MEKPVEYLIDPVTGCWMWQRAKTSAGYGVIRKSGRLVYAHREFYERFHGQFPQANDVCHKCDTPSCVNPDHLFLGNASINALDMVSKGRFRSPPMKGSLNGNSKLNEVDIPVIKKLAEAGMSQRAIGRRFGVSQFPIMQILKGRIWTHVKKDSMCGHCLS